MSLNKNKCVRTRGLRRVPDAARQQNAASGSPVVDQGVMLTDAYLMTVIMKRIRSAELHLVPPPPYMLETRGFDVIANDAFKWIRDVQGVKIAGTSLEVLPCGSPSIQTTPVCVVPECVETAECRVEEVERREGVHVLRRHIATTRSSAQLAREPTHARGRRRG